MPRRSPAPEERKRDPDRTREKILQAAIEEFSEHGFAGARVSSIAKRAGVNQQLISYYFDGKAGLYQAISQRWKEFSAERRPPDQPLGDVVANFVADSPQMRQLARLLLWDGLTGAGDDGTEFFLGMVAELRDRGISRDLDPGFLMLALFGAALAPAAVPHVARAMTGLDPDSPEFVAGYRDLLRRFVNL